MRCAGSGINKMFLLLLFPEHEYARINFKTRASQSDYFHGSCLLLQLQRVKLYSRPDRPKREDNEVLSFSPSSPSARRFGFLMGML